MMNSNRIAAAMNGNFAGAFGNDEQGQNFKPNPNPPLKENLLLFRKDEMYISLDLKAYYDNARGAYGEMTPAITARSHGTFYKLPANSDLLKEYAAFIMDLAEAIQDVEMDRSQVNLDVESAKKKLQRFRSVKKA